MSPEASVFCGHRSTSSTEKLNTRHWRGGQPWRRHDLDHGTAPWLRSFWFLGHDKRTQVFQQLLVSHPLMMVHSRVSQPVQVPTFEAVTVEKLGSAIRAFSANRSAKFFKHITQAGSQTSSGVGPSGAFQSTWVQFWTMGMSNWQEAQAPEVPQAECLDGTCRTSFNSVRSKLEETGGGTTKGFHGDVRLKDWIPGGVGPGKAWPTWLLSQ